MWAHALCANWANGEPAHLLLWNTKNTIAHPGNVVPYEVEFDDNAYSQTHGWRIHATDDNFVIR